jgi:hypothetical protein
MAYIMIRCPATDAAVFTRKMASEASFAAEDYAGSAMRCSSCNSIHHWDRSDAWLQPVTPLRAAE